jgi:hypothetical protein
MNELLDKTKDKVAQGYGYNSWKSLTIHYEKILKESVPQRIQDEVTLMYTKEIDTFSKIETVKYTLDLAIDEIRENRYQIMICDENNDCACVVYGETPEDCESKAQILVDKLNK